MHHEYDITTLFESASRLLPFEGHRTDQGERTFPLPVIRTSHFQLIVNEKKESITMSKLKYMVDLLTSNFFKFVCASLVIALQFYVSGCATPKAWDLAKRKASPTNCTYLKITDVHSAVEQKNGDISICVDLDGLDDGTESKSYTLTLPVSLLAEDTTNVETLGFRPSLFSSVDTYWYPIEKATRGCVASNSEHGSPESLPPIERLTLPAETKYQLRDIMSNLAREQEKPKKLYEVTFHEEALEVGLYSYDRATGKMVFEQSKENKEVILVYYPSRAGREDISPLIIAGGYEDTKTNRYYLLVPPALAFDAALLAAMVAITATITYGPSL